ncbi:MAG: DUF58 domain-containing protein [Alphaproteobacteria bacterium]|nr:DUF58 domain-containing protein [Alphaproteobacteria bacterium]
MIVASPVPSTGRGLRQRAEQLAAAVPPLMVAAERVAATVAQGVHGRRRVGQGETFWQFRRFEQGDAPSQVDWRQSGKRQSLFVRQNEWEAAESVWLWRDASPSMTYRSRGVEQTKRERAELLLLALATLLIRGGERVALLDEKQLPTTGRATIERLAQHITRFAAREGPSLPERTELPRFAQVVLFGDFLSPAEETESLVRRLAAGGVKGALMQVLDPSEEDFPFSGRTRFEGLEGEGSLIIGRVETLREDYERRLADRRRALAAICRRTGWSYLSHRTDRPPQTALLALYAALSGGRDW